MAVSEFHVRQLNEKSATYSEAQWGATYSGSTKNVIDAVGGVYLPRVSKTTIHFGKIISCSYKITLLFHLYISFICIFLINFSFLCVFQMKIVCDSYLTYLHGLDAAKNLLSDLKGYPEFNMFLQVDFIKDLAYH